MEKGLLVFINIETIIIISVFSPAYLRDIGPISLGFL
jgi:hypothetical protein